MNDKRFSFAVYVEAETGTGRLLSACIQIRQGKSASVREFAKGNAFADYDKDGNFLGIELLGPCDAKTIDRIAKLAVAKKFIRSAVPAGMLVTV
jgi:hypothetical protein